ncbi:MAG: hypothetical protein ABSA41_21455 [Terriglobia bacterium]
MRANLGMGRRARAGRAHPTANEVWLGVLDIRTLAEAGGEIEREGAEIYA